ncbi:MAG TPA: glycosyltransferase family A protein, partial [Campylobacterales bacterium]|nr:glycosyltransferase family A protein [Campylobacterales bacterium]
MVQESVSVIIRTIGRRGLTRAIDSIAKQTYKNIELIVVNDSEKNLDWIKELDMGGISSLKLVSNNKEHSRCI